MDCSLYILRGYRLKFSNYYVHLSLKIGFIMANSAGPDEMLRFAAFHLGFTVFQNTPLGGFHYTKG